MAYTVAIGITKGGVGKTTMAANLATVASTDSPARWRGVDEPLRTLAIDLDEQADLGFDLGYRGLDGDDDGEGLAAAIVDGEPVVPITLRPNLDVVPGGPALERCEGPIARVEPEERMEMLRRVIASVEDDYDLVVIDAPPTLGLWSWPILGAADGLVMPVTPDPASVAAVGTTVAKILRAQKLGCDVRPVMAYVVHSVWPGGQAGFDANDQLVEMLGEAVAVGEIVPMCQTPAKAARQARMSTVDLALWATRNDKPPEGSGLKKYPKSLFTLGQVMVRNCHLVLDLTVGAQVNV